MNLKGPPNSNCDPMCSAKKAPTPTDPAISRMVGSIVESLVSHAVAKFYIRDDEFLVGGTIYMPLPNAVSHI